MLKKTCYCLEMIAVPAHLCALKDVFMAHVLLLINVLVTLVGLVVTVLPLVSVMGRVVVSMNLTLNTAMTVEITPL